MQAENSYIVLEVLDEEIAPLFCEADWPAAELAEASSIGFCGTRCWSADERKCRGCVVQTTDEKRTGSKVRHMLDQTDTPAARSFNISVIRHEIKSQHNTQQSTSTRLGISEFNLWKENM